ncbi:hypothetical protein MX101_04810 [Streptococcus uberis]|nr:hypothetical protein [Streptococcus uberis]MCK1255389.1 hypothetical protein [Streptococcus uberis]
MKSLTICNCERFDVVNTLGITMNGETVGSISVDTINPTLIFESKVVNVFSASLFLPVKENILVEIQGVEMPLDQYKTTHNFKIYYSAGSNKLIVDAPSPIAKKFIQAFRQAYSDKATINNCSFDFEKITRFTNGTKALYFDVNDTVVDSKGFFGDDIHTSPEADQAIKTNSATYLVAELDLLSKSRTIGFSQKGTLVFYSNLIDISSTPPEVQLALNCIDMFAN